MDDSTKMLAFKDWVPLKYRFWIYLLFLTVIQFSNGIYFASMTQMSADLGITSDDTLMLSYTVLIGLTMYFPLAFRLKSRFPNRTNLLIATLGLIACNLLVPQLHTMPVLIAVCFVAGFLRLYGTFECFSNIIFKVTPSYNYAVFLSFVFFVVIGVVQVHDIVGAQVTYIYGWRYVHYLASGLLMLVVIGVLTLMQPRRTVPESSLKGVDWLGMAVWTVFILALIFVAQYGNQLNWLASPYVRVAIGGSLIALGISLWRMRTVEQSYLQIASFKSRNLWYLLILFLFMDVLLSTQHVLQNIFTNEILHYDYLHNTSLKWFEFFGVLLGAVFSWQFMMHTQNAYKSLMTIGMASLVGYIAAMYLLVSPDINIEKLYAPLLLAGFGHVIIFISLTVYANKNVAFANYFQVLCILGFVRMGVAAPIGNAIYSRAVTGTVAQNLAVVGAEGMNTVLLATLRDLFGWSFLVGVVILLLIALSRFKR